MSQQTPGTAKVEAIEISRALVELALPNRLLGFYRRFFY
jgi:hypothetical protein